jgi:TPR repeat protein
MELIQMKKLLIVFILCIAVLIFIPETNTKKEFYLTEKELIYYNMMADKNDTQAFLKLYRYYSYSSNDINSTLLILRQGALSGDPKLQYMLARRLLYGFSLSSDKTNDKKKLEEAIYWLKLSSKQGYAKATKELKHFTSSISP